MRYSFRLAELLNHVPDPRRRPGRIKAICDYTGLDRHQVASLLKNRAKYIPLNTLSLLCDYLVEHGYAEPQQLPGALFGIEPENFWELLSRRKRLEFCLGVRREQDWPDGDWMRAGDSILLGEMLSGISNVRQTVHEEGAGKQPSGPKSPSLETPTSPAAPGAPGGLHPETLKQSLVWAPRMKVSGDDVQRRAHEVYNHFSEVSGDKAMVAIGSVKSNPVVELIFAATFGAKEWHSQDDVTDAHQRQCPIFLRYREEDPQPASCCSGMKLYAGQTDARPGIYYQRKDGKWGHCRYEEDKYDVAMVFYAHSEPLGRLEMVLGGFSGRATRLLARTLATQSHEFWPPVHQGQGVEVGAFVIEYTLKPKGNEHHDILGAAPIASQKIIRLDSSAIAERIANAGL